MSTRVVACLLSCALLLGGGCALQPPRSALPAPVVDSPEAHTTAQKLRDQARVLRYAGRYTEALRHLDEAVALDPTNTDLRDERTQTRLSWSRLQLELRDRLLLIEAGARAERRPLVEKLVLADPGDQAMQAELIRLRDSREADLDGLAECGEHQARRQRQLAMDCLRLALSLEDRPALRDRLAALEQRPKASAPRPRPKTGAAAVTPTAANGAATDDPAISPPPATAAVEPPELLKARGLMADGKYFGAIRHLTKLQDNGLDSPASRRLLAEARSALDENSRVLLDAGDRLYQQGRVKEALALWDAALSLDPYNPEARKKSQRASKVLNNLQSLGGANPPGERN